MATKQTPNTRFKAEFKRTRPMVDAIFADFPMGRERTARFNAATAHLEVLQGELKVWIAERRAARAKRFMAKGHYTSQDVNEVRRDLAG